MPTFTSRIVTTRPIHIDTVSTLSEIREELLSIKPSLSSLSGGWGAVDDSESNIGFYGVLPPLTNPELVEAAEDTPKHLLARYYFYEKSAPREKALPESPRSDWYRLSAVDCLITKSGENSLLVVFSTRNMELIGRTNGRRRGESVRDIGALVSLERAIRAVDARFQTSVDRSCLHFGSGDFFLWIMRCWHEQRNLGSMELIGATGLSGRDRVQRSTLLQQGVDFGRIGFLTSVVEGDELGPVTVEFKNVEQEAVLDIELWLDGGFTVHANRVQYRDILSGAELRLRAVKDMIFKYIPEFRQLHQADETWSSTRRNSFIREANSAIVARYSRDETVDVACPHCGEQFDFTPSSSTSLAALGL
ncbi:hypothetical protein [Rathayibacter sp. AY1E4]|uniref:hypothetical protein n=1 Tax=Rathayibacter sp. AY1E4 TaxID=2080552 RepID=UPI0011B0C223|nr:hypothetical protein [Rathayibacter sp. AY1E4]